MKILDRYVLTTFLKNYLLSFIVLVGLYIVMDMLFNFDELMAPAGAEVGSKLGALLCNIGNYYFYQIFLVFVHLSGIIPVVAAAFTLMRLSRFNELSAMLSSGVPLLRISMPIILAAVVLNGLLLVDQEAIIPLIIPELVRSHADVSGSSENYFEVHAMRVGDSKVLVAGRYTPHSDKHPPTLDELSIIEYADQRPARQISARKAVWNEDRQTWQLQDSVVMNHLAPGEIPTTQPLAPAIYNGGITPDAILLYRNGDFSQLLSTEKINELLDDKTNQHYGINQLERVKHTRFAQPILNIILLLLAIPCVLTREPGQLRRAALKCLILTCICMACIFVCSTLAGRPPNSNWAGTWPAVMAWTPILIFGPICVWLLDRVES